MNVDTLTIGNILSRPVAPQPPAGLRPDATAEKRRSCPVRERPEQPTDATRRPKSHQARAKTPDKTTRQDRKDFRKVIDKRTKPGESEQSTNRSVTKSQNTEAKASGQAESAQNVAVQNPDFSEQNRKQSASKNTPDTRQQLAGLIDTSKAKKAQQGSENSIENKVDGNRTVQTTKTEKVATGKSNNIPVDASIHKADNSESPNISNKTATKPTEVTKEGNVKELSSVEKTFNNTKTAGHSKVPSVAEKSSEPASSKASTKATEHSTNQKPDPGAKSTADMGTAKTSRAVISAATSKTEAADVIKQTKTETSADNTDKAASTVKVILKDQEKSQPTSDTCPTGRQTPAKQAITFGDKIVNGGNSTENAASKTGESQTPMGRTQSGNSHNSGDSFNENSKQIRSQNGAQTPVTEQASTFSVATKAPILSEQPQPAPGNGPANVASQVLEAVRNSVSQQPTGDKEITIQLNPPELGKVSLKFQQQGAEITGTLEVSKAQTRAEIEQALPEMIRNLADSGIAIKRLEVVLSQNDQPDQQSAKGPLPQNDQYQQQGSANPNQSGEQQQTKQTSYGPTAHSRYQYLNYTDPYEMLITNTSVNMLA
jgi:flagellar hook-length control protein FliK